MITLFAMSTSDNYVKKTLTMVGLGLQICTCKTSAGSTEIMSIHEMML
jgi:hypothetical protein